MSVSIKDIEYIYIKFRQAQSDYKNRGWRMPKDFESHFNEKFKEQNKKPLIKITGWFLTKWQNIDPYKYFQCGFELYKTFSYTKFFNEKIIILYINKDKNEKRKIDITKKSLIKSAKFVKNWMNVNSADFNMYINNREGNHRIAVDHYLLNKIEAPFFVFLLRNGLVLTDEERSLVPYIQANFRKIMFGLNDLNDFLVKLRRIL